MIRYILNGTELQTEPKGWEDKSTVIKLDQTLKARLVEIQCTLVFHGDGYTILKDFFDNNFCGRVDILIQEKKNGFWRNRHVGCIFIPTCIENEKDLSMTAIIQDNSFYSKIYNNRNLDFVINVGRSKNDVTITATPEYLIECFNQCTGTSTLVDRKGFLVYDTLKFLVAAMTDNEMECDSTYFGPGGDEEGLAIITGARLRRVVSGVDPAPKISFGKLMIELDRKKNIGFWIDHSGSKPKLWVEKFEDLNQPNVLLSCSDIIEIQTAIDVEKLYSKVSLGSSQLLTPTNCPGNNFPADIDFVGFKSEDFMVLGTCNLGDRVLDLKSDWIIDTNIINACVNQGLTDYDKDVFLIETNGANHATKTDVFSTTPQYWYYNNRLRNNEVAQRYLKAVPNSIASYLGNKAYDFIASRNQNEQIDLSDNVTSHTTAILVYDDDFNPPFFDLGGQYDNTNGRFTAPLGGAYMFDVYQYVFCTKYESGPLSNYNIGVKIHIEIRDNTNALKATVTSPIGSFGTTGTHFFQMTGLFAFMAATDYAQVYIEYYMFGSGFGSNDGNGVTFYQQAGIYDCLNAVTGGGVYKTYDPADFPIYLPKFEYDLTEDDLELLINDSRGVVKYGKNSINLRSGYIQEVIQKKGKSTFKLVKALNYPK